MDLLDLTTGSSSGGTRVLTDLHHPGPISFGGRGLRRRRGTSRVGAGGLPLAEAAEWRGVVLPPPPPPPPPLLLLSPGDVAVVAVASAAAPPMADADLDAAAAEVREGVRDGRRDCDGDDGTCNSDSNSPPPPPAPDVDASPVSSSPPRMRPSSASPMAATAAATRSAFIVLGVVEASSSASCAPPPPSRLCQLSPFGDTVFIFFFRPRPPLSQSPRHPPPSPFLFCNHDHTSVGFTTYRAPRPLCAPARRFVLGRF
jgi:hypothetical protein